jgi:hypothetical protein
MSNQTDNYWAKASSVTGRAMSLLMNMLGSGSDNPEITNDVCDIVQVLMETDPKKLSKLKSKMSHKQRAFLGVQKNRELAESLKKLETEFSIRNIAEFLRYQDTKPMKGKKSHSKKSDAKTRFSVKDTAMTALEGWMSKSLKKLPYEEVQDQFMSWVFQEMKPTDLQHGLHELMKSDGQIARLVIAPTGAGKTFGYGAVMGLCTDSLLCYSPANRTSMQDFIGSTTSAQVPVCYVGRDSTGKLEYVSIFETMGKAKSSSLEEMSDFLLKNKQQRKTRFKTHIPRIVVCDPSMRESGLVEVYAEISRYCHSLRETRTLKPTLVIDDFCASVEDTESCHDAHSLMSSVDRIVLLTATPPSNMDVVNTIRTENSLCPITEDTYSKTLGMGVRLVSNNGTPVTLLDNLDVFDLSPFALSTLTPTIVFTLMKEVYGEKEARDVILSKLPYVTLDDLRDDLVRKLRDIRDSGGDVEAVINCIPVEDIHETKHGKCLVLDKDPLDRLHCETVDPIQLLSQSANGTERSWVSLLHKDLDRFMAQRKKQEVIQEKCKNSKKRNDGERSDEMERYSDISGEVFMFPGLHSYFESMSDDVMKMLTSCESNGITEEELCYVLQKRVLVVTKDTQRFWIGSVLQHVHTIYGDESMSAGVHISRLCKVRLPRQMVSPEINIQGMGRVGRPHQGAGIVEGSTEQFAAMFSVDVGNRLAGILAHSVATVCERPDLIDDVIEVVAEESKVNVEVVETSLPMEDEQVQQSLKAKPKKSCRSVEARQRRNKKKRERKKKKNIE